MSIELHLKNGFKPTTISVCGCEISFSSSVRNLGFYIRDDMSMELHIKNICWSAYSELCCISTILHLPSADSTKTLVSAFVLSRLDYCNSLLSGCPKHRLEKLQKVKNSAARLVLKAHKQDHVSPLLRTLHWLPIQARIEYKLSTLSLLLLWYSPCLSVWPSPCLLSSKTAPLLIWLQNFTHSTQKDQNIWTSFIFPCCSFCLEFSASWY